MTTHLTLRLAWHNDGWNGHVCKKPARNTYCVGCASYPGDLIREQRDLATEKTYAGEPFEKLEVPPACMYSGSAFSESSSQVLAEPPEFFKDNTETKHWTIPPATACTWPYDAMYNKDDIRRDNRYDYGKRLQYSEEHFDDLEPSKSLVFYYANYSNPVSDDENSVYLLIGVARISNVGPTMYYDGCSEETLERYKGFIWQRAISSTYPEEGLRLPYHRYLDNPDQLRHFATVPENSSLCKYATKQVTDDEALGLLEQLLESTRIVRDDLQDDSENWTARIEWLESLIGELWKSRGAYPGMPAILEFFGLEEAISGFKRKTLNGDEQKAFEEVIAFCHGDADHVTDFYPLEEDLPSLKRSVALNADGNLEFMLNVLSRISLGTAQVKAILSKDRVDSGITASLENICNNPYLLSEQYKGIDPSDTIRWSMLDRAMLPAPELAAKELFTKNSPERTRALLLETIRGFGQQTFISAPVLIEKTNRRILAQPEWKQNLLTEQYLEVDRSFYSEAIYQRQEASGNYLYDLNVWNDERFVQSKLDDLLTASDINLKHPVADELWNKFLFQEQSDLAQNARQEYLSAIESQKASCKQIIHKRLATITGGAGTGKTTVVATLIKAIRKAHGDGVGIAVLTPTGKAADRLRSTFQKTQVSGVNTATIHSILASHGWLNDNMTYRMSGGTRVSEYSTVVIDESSMIDLSLMAALFRAIDWNAISRLILVGDAAQLPPIGVGKVYADIVTYLREQFEDHLVVLTKNLRQLENRVSDQGCSILELANCFINSCVKGGLEESEDTSFRRENLIRKLHESGEIDKDLSVYYWDDEESVTQQLIDQITTDLTNDDNKDQTPERRVGTALKDNVNVMQILSPVRGELIGTEHINTQFQAFKSSYWLQRGPIDGIAMFDKVIQIRNVQKTRPLTAYNFSARVTEDVQVFNGEIGGVVPTGNWKQFFSKSRWNGFRLKNFSVQFSGKEHQSVNYGSGANSKPENNLELAYAISVHKAQGSEFERVYFVLPAGGASRQMMELIYTALTRASRHCTIFVEKSVESFIDCMRPEQSALTTINSSLFKFSPVNEILSTRKDWYEAGRIHKALTGDMVRSKSEVIIANMLHEREISFYYEKPLIAKDGSMYLPDFTLVIRGEEYYWEHLGMLDKPEYQRHWEEKQSWYEQHFSGQLVTTTEGPDLSDEASAVIRQLMKQ
jgi:thymidylate kinase